MQVCSNIPEVREAIRAARRQGSRIGCVPTMGALHEGHLSLMAECRKHVDFVVATIFVNPSQFAPHEDLEQYPRPLESDLAKCEQAGVGLVFTPAKGDLYPEGFETWVMSDRMANILEGEFRPTHFRGVLTIVLKLLNILGPDVACFGDKDYQQQTLIRRMVADLNVPTEILVCPTVREPDGLAMSSRNAYLNVDERKTAGALFEALTLADELASTPSFSVAEAEKQMLQHLEGKDGVRVDYAVIRDPDTLEVLSEPSDEMVALIAAHVGQTRLIDHHMIRRNVRGTSH